MHARFRDSICIARFVQWKKRSKEGVQEKKISERVMLQKQQKANEEGALLETEEQLTEKGADIKEVEKK